VSDERTPALSRLLLQLRSWADSNSSEGRRALSHLRRAASGEPDALLVAMRFVVPYLDVPEHQLDEALLLASLFATHPDRGTASLGEAMAAVKERRNSESIELRFTALLQAERADLADHLRSAVALCRSQPVALDWAKMAEMIRYWDHPRASEAHGVRRSCATDFWRRRNDDTAPAEPTTP